MFKSVIAAVAMLLPITPALTQGAKSARDPEEVVCKAQAKTNTRFQKKICRTRAEWEVISEAAKRAAKELIDKPAPNYCDGQGCPGGG